MIQTKKAKRRVNNKLEDKLSVKGTKFHKFLNKKKQKNDVTRKLENRIFLNDEFFIEIENP